MKPVAPRDFPSVTRMFYERAASLGDAPFVHVAHAEGWRTFSWRECAQASAGVAAGLAALGIGRGDRVLLVSENRFEWLVADIAALTLGAIVVPGYSTATADDWLHIARDSGARLAIVSRDVAQRLGPRGREIADAVGEAIVFEERSWQDLRRNATPADFESSIAAASLDDTACIMYTSGTGGKPRGVETTHRNILGNCLGAATTLEAYGLEDNRFLCFLPLSHTYAHTGDLWTPVSIGAQVFLSRGTDHLAAEFAHARPTMMNTVPRFWEVMYKRIAHALERERALRRGLFAAAVRTGGARLRGEPLGPLDRIADALAERTVRAKVRARFGGALRCTLSAGAPLNPAISTFFNALGIRLHEAYGQTECAPGIAMIAADRIVPGCVGAPMAGMEVRLADDGEVLVRGDNVMKGYWNDPAATAAALAGGWLHTGDIGQLDALGMLRITDRKRDFLKTAGGEMVAPQAVEQALLVQGAIGQAMVCGDAKAYLTALVVPSDELRADCEAGRVDRPSLETLVAQAVSAANRTLAPMLRVRRFKVLDRPFAIDTGLLTPTLKVRRRMVLQAYEREIESMYAA